MSLIVQHRPISALSCLLSGVLLSAGIVLCLFESWTDGPECSLERCSLYSGATVFGSSLFAWGAGVFAVLICALPTRYFRTVSLLAVAADMPLLAWQVIFGPCGKCLLVASLLLINAHVAGWGTFPAKKTATIALCIAAVLLCLNIGALTSEAIRPWLTEHIRTVPLMEGLKPFLPPTRDLSWQGIMSIQ